VGKRDGIQSAGTDNDRLHDGSLFLPGRLRPGRLTRRQAFLRHAPSGARSPRGE
jgi:hypothetical protein